MAAKIVLTKTGQIEKNFSMAELLVKQTETFTMTEAKWKDIELQAKMLQEFRNWYGKPMTITSWLRSTSSNKKVGGISGSNHLKGKATDWHCGEQTKANFIKYAKKWKEICEKHGVVGEAGRYTWGIHLGYQLYSKTFYHWSKVETGKQVNLPYKELL